MKRLILLLFSFALIAGSYSAPKPVPIQKDVGIHQLQQSLNSDLSAYSPAIPVQTAIESVEVFILPECTASLNYIDYIDFAFIPVPANLTDAENCHINYGLNVNWRTSKCKYGFSPGGGQHVIKEILI